MPVGPAVEANAVWAAAASLRRDNAKAQPPPLPRVTGGPLSQLEKGYDQDYGSGQFAILRQTTLPNSFVGSAISRLDQQQQQDELRRRLEREQQQQDELRRLEQEQQQQQQDELRRRLEREQQQQEVWKALLMFHRGGGRRKSKKKINIKNKMKSLRRSKSLRKNKYQK
jgi:hypothetical protein